MFVSYSLHMSIVGFFTRQKRIRGGSTFGGCNSVPLKQNLLLARIQGSLSQCHAWLGLTQYSVQLAKHTHMVYIELGGGRQAGREGRMRGGREGARGRWEGRMEQEEGGRK